MDGVVKVKKGGIMADGSEMKMLVTWPTTKVWMQTIDLDLPKFMKNTNEK